MGFRWISNLLRLVSPIHWSSVIQIVLNSQVTYLCHAHVKSGPTLSKFNLQRSKQTRQGRQGWWKKVSISSSYFVVCLREKKTSHNVKWRKNVNHLFTSLKLRTPSSECYDWTHFRKNKICIRPRPKGWNEVIYLKRDDHIAPCGLCCRWHKDYVIRLSECSCMAFK